MTFDGPTDRTDRADRAARLDLQAREILDFWFGAPGSATFGRGRKIWFNGGAAFDDLLRTRYGALHDAACDGACDHWAGTPLGALALIVVLDQFSRNIHRGTPRAFAADPRALALARRVVLTREAGFTPFAEPAASGGRAADGAHCSACWSGVRT